MKQVVNNHFFLPNTSLRDKHEKSKKYKDSLITSRQKNFISDTWDKVAESYDFFAQTQPDYLSNYYHLTKNIGKLKNKKILEVGSGSGQVSAYLASKGASVYLVDISEKSLEFSKNFFKVKKLPVYLYKQDAFKMKFKDESFDFVWNSGVLEHYDDEHKLAMLKEMLRLVKKGGKLIVCVPNSFDLFFLLAKYILKLRKKWAFGYEDNVNRFKIIKLIRRLGNLDYKIYTYNPIVGFWFLPYGRELTDVLGLNNFDHHKKETFFGHVIICVVDKL